MESVQCPPTITIDYLLQEYADKTNLELKKIVADSYELIKDKILRNPSFISLCYGPPSVPFVNFNIEKNEMEIYISPIYLRPYFTRLRSKEDRDAALCYIFSHEIIEASLNAPRGFKIIFNNFFGGLLSPLNNRMLRLEPSPEAVELCCDDLVSDIKTDRLASAWEINGRGLLVAHRVEAGVYKREVSEWQVSKSEERFLSSHNPYEMIFAVIAMVRHVVIKNHVIQKYPNLRGYGTKYGSLFSLLLKKLIYPELKADVFKLRQELEKDDPDKEVLYRISMSFVNKVKTRLSPN